MKYKFNYSKEEIFKGISDMVFENARVLGNKNFSDLNNVTFTYKSNGEVFSVKTISVIENESLIMETELQGKEKYTISYELKGKKKTTLIYKNKLVSNSKLLFWNHMILSKSIFYFSQRSKFKEMCRYIEGKINE